MAVIEFESLSKTFGSVDALRDVTFSIEVGETFGYLGPNGAGKTTTIRCLIGLITPSAGRALLFDTDVRTGLPGLLARVGYLPGEFGLWPALSGDGALDYLAALHPSAARARASLCDRFDLSAADLARPVRTYSRGMRQKIGLIQAFQHQPELVVLDEPTEGLDPVMQQRFIDLLGEHRARGGTTLMSSHILSEVERACDRVAIVKEGHLVRLGTPASLASAGVRRCVVRAPGIAAALDAVAGVTGLTVHGDLARFGFTGATRDLVRALAPLDLEEFTCEPERLSDTFFEVFGS